MQSVGIEELHESEGVLLEATSTPPGMGAVSAPGYGTHLLRSARARRPDTATLGAMIADEPSGRVFGSRDPLIVLPPRQRRRGESPDRHRSDGAGNARRLGADHVELGGGAPPVKPESARSTPPSPASTCAACASPASTRPAPRPGARPVPPPGRPGRPTARRRRRLGRRRLDPPQLPRGQPPGLDHGDRRRRGEVGARLGLQRREARAGRCHSTWPSPSRSERPSTSSHSCSIRFRRATASGGWAATSAASSSAASSVAAAGATRLTRPSRSASSAPTVREESSRYLAAARPQRVTRRAGPTGHPERRAGEAHAQVGAADPHVAGDRDLGAAADHVAVAGGDRRLGEGDDLVVEVGEELHAPHLALLVELLLDVGAGREAHVVGGADHEHAHRLVGARHRQVLEHLDQHLGVHRVAGIGPLQAQQRHALLVDLVAGHLGFAIALIARQSDSLSSATSALGLVGGALDQRLDLLAAARGSARARRRRRPRDRSSRACRPRPAPARTRRRRSRA